MPPREPRDPMQILVTEQVDEAGLELLRRAHQVAVALTQDPAELRRLIADADAIIVKGSTRLSAEVLMQAPRLKAIGRVGNGLDNIDLAYASAHQIMVFNSPEGSVAAVAEFAIMQMLALCRRAYEVHRAWLGRDYRRGRFLGCELRSRRVGIIGYGRIGSEVAQLLRAFNCQRAAWDTDLEARRRAEERGVATAASLDELMGRCDLLSLHVPLTQDTRELINARRLRLAPRGVLLLNLARGGLIDEAALLEAIRDGHVAAAAIDVLAKEPSYDVEPSQQRYANALLDEPRVILTPHLAASTYEAQRTMSVAVAQQLIHHLKKAVVMA